MKNQIKTNQIALILALIIPGGKYMTLPALIGIQCGRDSWIAFAFAFFIDLVCLCAILWAIGLNKTGKSINQILSDTISPFFAKIIFIILGVFFLARVMGLLVNSIELFSSTFTVKTNWLAYSIPIAVTTIFIVSRGMNNIGRVAEMLFVIIILAVISVLVFSLNQADLSNLKPILDDGFAPVLKGFSYSSFWFSDGLFILFVMDYFRPNKKYFISISGAMVLGAVLTILMDILFIALFDQLTTLNNIAMNKVSQFSIYLTTSGRLDWLTMSVWLLSVFIKVCVLVFCVNRCFKFIFNISEIKTNYWTLSLVFLPIVVLPIFVGVGDVINTFNQMPLSKYIIWPVQYLLPLLLPLFTFLSNKKSEKSQLLLPLEEVCEQ